MVGDRVRKQEIRITCRRMSKVPLDVRRRIKWDDCCTRLAKPVEGQWLIEQKDQALPICRLQAKRMNGSGSGVAVRS